MKTKLSSVNLLTELDKLENRNFLAEFACLFAICSGKEPQTEIPFISIYSTDPSLAKIFDFYMKSLWERAEPVNFEKIALALGK